MGRNPETLLRNFHEARWDEPIIFEMSTPGERGVLPPKADPAVIDRHHHFLSPLRRRLPGNLGL